MFQVVMFCLLSSSPCLASILAQGVFVQGHLECPPRWVMGRNRKWVLEEVGEAAQPVSANPANARKDLMNETKSKDAPVRQKL